MRYRVKVGESIQVTVRHQPSHAARTAKSGERVRLAWRAEDTLLIPRE
jgi:hypothetical protein